MPLPRVFVIDNSEAVRETLAIVLGSVAEVSSLSPRDCSASFPVPDGRPDLLIANGDSVAPLLLQALAGSACPVIWLRADPNQGAPLAALAGRSVVIPYRFDGHVLARQVTNLLAQRLEQPQRPQLSDKLAYPYLTRDAALVAREAMATQLPVLICGEPGTGRARVASAIAASDASAPLVTLTPQRCTPEALEGQLSLRGSRLTLFVDDVDSADPDTQALLLEIVESSGLLTSRGWLALRVIGASAGEIGTLAHTGAFSRDLYYRLNVLPITLTPLRDRPDDIPALVRAVSSDFCAALGLLPVAFTPRATQRLRRYLWFGNVAELETVLARTISLVRKEVFDVGDLLFGYGPIIPAAAAEAPPPEITTAPLSTKAVDLIINELAHEFRNPLATIKTFAQHLDQLLEEEAGRDQLTLLTGQAVDRMDRALENLLQFTRFRDPVRQRLPLAAVIGPTLNELGTLLTERHLTLDYRPPSATVIVHVDPNQVQYALSNLLRSLIRDVNDGQVISLRCVDAGTFTVRVPSANGGLSAKLRNLLPSREPDEEFPLPLGMALARSLIDRNGGRLELDTDAPAAAITVWLPADGGARRMPAEDGTTTNSHR